MRSETKVEKVYAARMARRSKMASAAVEAEEFSLLIIKAFGLTTVFDRPLDLLPLAAPP